MLRTGIVLLAVSSLMVFLRISEFSLFQTFYVKVLCMSGLLTAFSIFMGYYLKVRPGSTPRVRVSQPRQAFART